MGAAVAPTKQTPQWGAILNGEKRFPLHAGQRDIMRSDARFLAAIAGTGGGKTALGPVWVAREIRRVMESRDITDEPVRGLVVAPTYPVMARATAPMLVKTFADTDLQGRYVESKNRYWLPDGIGVLWTLSADNPHGLEGGQFDFAWIDEGGQLSYEAWVAIQARLGQRQGRCLITTTPYGQNWLFHRFFKYAKDGDPNYYVRQFPSILNPAYPREEYERARQSMSPQRFAMRYDGAFVKLAGLVYPEFEHCVCRFSEVPDGPLYGGLDFGWTDPFACHVGALDRDGVLWIWYERYKSYCLIEDHAKAMPKGVTYYAPHDRPDLAAKLRKLGHKVRPNRTRDVMTGIDAVTARIYQGKLKIHEHCRAIRAEAEEYSFPQKDDEVSGDKPVDGFDHALDDLRYLIGSIDKREMAKAA